MDGNRKLCWGWNTMWHISEQSQAVTSKPISSPVFKYNWFMQYFTSINQGLMGHRKKKHETGSIPVSDTTVHHSNMHGQHAYRGTLKFTYSTTTKTLTYTLCKYTNTYMNPVGWGSIVYCQAWDNMGFVLLQLWDWPLDSQHSAYTITVTVALYTKWQSWNKLFSDDTEK